MISHLQQFFERYLSEQTEDPEHIQSRLRLACAALMVEMLYADDVVTGDEEETLNRILDERFDLSSNETRSLIELAHARKQDATDYYAFTALLNEHFSQQQKVDLVEDLWRLAYSDNRLDKFEEHLLRRLAELLHVPHHDFIRTKHRVLESGRTRD